MIMKIAKFIFPYANECIVEGTKPELPFRFGKVRTLQTVNVRVKRTNYFS